MEPHMIEYLELAEDSLDRIAPLWEKLRNHHADRALDFRESFTEMTWAERKKKLTAGGKRLKIFLAKPKAEEAAMGYCIASIDHASAGEIDSIYIESTGRGLGIGRAFIERALTWFAEEKVRDITIDVAVGNEEALPFYEKFGFKPRTYHLCRIQP